MEDEDAEMENPGTRDNADQDEKWSAAEAEAGVPCEGLRERAGGWSEA